MKKMKMMKWMSYLILIWMNFKKNLIWEKKYKQILNIKMKLLLKNQIKTI